MRKVHRKRPGDRALQPVHLLMAFFVSGQIAIHPPTGELITTDIEAETHQVL